MLLKGDCHFVINGGAVWGKGCGFVAAYPTPLVVVTCGSGRNQKFVVAYPAEVEIVALFIPAVVEIVADGNHVVVLFIVAVEP